MITTETSLSIIGFDELANGIIVVRDSGAIMGANAAMVRLLGRDIGSLVGQPLSSVLTHSSAVLYQAVLYQQLRGSGVVPETGLDFKREDGQEIAALCSAALHEQGPQAFVVISVTMMVNRRRIEEDLMRSRRIAEQAPGVVYQYKLAVDGTHSMPYASEALLPIFGVLPEEVADSADLIFSAVHPDDRSGFLAAIQESARTLGKWRGQFRIRHRAADGTVNGWRWVEGTSTPERLGDGSTVWYGFAQDVTERKALEDALCDRQASEAASAARNEFLARVSHELRTPLNAILGFAQVLSLDKMQPLQSLQRKRVSHIEEAGRDLLSLVDEVLDITSIDSGMIVEEPQWINVKSLLTRVSRLVEETVLARRVHLNLVAHSTFSVYADQARLAQILGNLMSNATKFVDEGGTVSVTCVVVDRKLTISVHDTGPGLTQAEIEHLFEPFNSFGAERATIAGAGLGLVIVKRLVDAMEGSITVSSGQLTGTTFDVVLPQRLHFDEVFGEPAVAVPSLPKSASDARRIPTVLYVEDNPVNAMIMQAICEMQSGMYLHVESSAADALAWARDNSADLFLLDMSLPDADGIGLLAQLREQSELARRDRMRSGVPSEHADIEAIAVSADATPDLIERAQQAGFSQYWTKPLNVDATLDKIAWALGIPRTLLPSHEMSAMSSVL